MTQTRRINWRLGDREDISDAIDSTIFTISNTHHCQALKANVLRLTQMMSPSGSWSAP